MLPRINLKDFLLKKQFKSDDLKKDKSKSKLKEINIDVKKEEVILNFNDCLNYIPKIKISLLPGIFEYNFFLKLISIVCYLICILLVINGDYFVSIAFYSVILLIHSVIKEINFKKRKIKVKKNVYFIILSNLLFISSVVLMLFLGGYKSKFFASTVCYFVDVADYLEVNIDKQYIYDIASLVGGKDPLPYLKKGILLFQNGDIDGAKKNIEIAEQTSFKNYEIFYLLGKIYLDEGNLEKAEISFKNAIQLNSSYAPLLTEYTKIFLNKGDLQEAEKLATKALSLSPNAYEANRVMGSVLFEKGNYKDALDKYEKAISINPNLSYLYAEKAIALYLNSRSDEAIITVEEALKLNPNDSYSNYIKGVILFKKNQFQESLKFFTKSLKIKNNYPIVRGYLAASYNRLGDEKKYLQEMENIKKINEKNCELNYIKSLIYLERYELESSLKEIEEALLLNKNKGKYKSLKADIMLEFDDYTTAYKLINESISNDKNDPYAYFVKGKYLCLIENFDESDDAYKKAFELDQYFSRAYVGFALAINSQNDKEKAYEYLNQAFNLSPDDYYYNYIKANIDYERRRFESASTYINKAIEKNNKSIPLLLLKSKILIETGKSSEALEVSNLAIKLRPNDYSSLLCQANSIKNDNDAILKLNAITTKFQNNYEAYVSLAERFLKTNNFVDAIKNINKAIELNKGSYQSYLTKYNILSIMQSKLPISQDEVMSTIDAVIKSNKNFSDAYYYKGFEFQKQKKYQEAIAQYDQSIKLDSNFHNCVVKKSDTYTRLYEVYTALNDKVKLDDVQDKLKKAKKRENLGIY